MFNKPFRVCFLITNPKTKPIKKQAPYIIFGWFRFGETIEPQVAEVVLRGKRNKNLTTFDGRNNFLPR